jgi:hypothetical protein
MQVSELKRLCKESKIKFSNKANKAASVDLLLNSLASETAINVDALGGVNLDKTQNRLQAVHSCSRQFPRSKMWQMPASFRSLPYVNKHGKRVVEMSASVKVPKFLSCSVSMI